MSKATQAICSEGRTAPRKLGEICTFSEMIRWILQSSIPIKCWLKLDWSMMGCAEKWCVGTNSWQWPCLIVSKEETWEACLNGMQSKGRHGHGASRFSRACDYSKPARQAETSHKNNCDAGGLRIAISNRFATGKVKGIEMHACPVPMAAMKHSCN